MSVFFSDVEDKDVRTQLNQLMKWARDFRTSRVLTTAVERNILERFSGGKTIDGALQTEENHDAFGRFVRTLNAIGLLDQTKNDGFQPSKLTKSFLLPSSELNLRPIIKLFHRNYELWKKLPETLTEGHDVESNLFGDVEFGRDFMLAMETRAHFSKKDVAEELEGILNDEDEIIDLGGGTGVFIREILRKYPSTEAVLADQSHVVETARDFSENSTVKDRLSFRELDFFEDENYGNDFDVALLFSVCHMFNHDSNRTLLTRTSNALKPGGQLVIRDYLLDENGVGPLESNLFDLHMILATDSGRNYSLNDYEDLLESSGLKLQTRIAVEGPDDLIIAEKPA